MKQEVKATLLRVARSSVGARLAGVVFGRVPQLLPGRLVVAPELVILTHPVPTEPGHVLAVSRRRIPNALVSGERADEFWQGIEDEWMSLEETDFGLTNLGDRQDVALLHVHLLRSRPRWSNAAPRVSASTLAGAIAALRTTGEPASAEVTSSIGFAHIVPGEWGVWLDIA